MCVTRYYSAVKSCFSICCGRTKIIDVFFGGGNRTEDENIKNNLFNQPSIYTLEEESYRVFNINFSIDLYVDHNQLVK